MADYSQVNDYSAKDALSTGNPLKLIKGSDVDQEFSAIAAAIASKFDSTDIATAGEAQAGVSNVVVITPARLTAWAQNAAGILEDLQALTDPGADRLLFWDDSAGAVTFLTAGTGIAITGTTISVDAGGLGGRTLTAGVGLSGGGDLSADRTFDLDINELTTATVAAADEFAFADASDSDTPKKLTFASLEGAINHNSLTAYVSAEHVSHTAVNISAGQGLSGGGDISASRSLALDISGLTEETTIDPTNDVVVFYDASATAHRKVPADAFLGTALGDAKFYRNAVQALSAATEATLVFNTTDYNELQRGTYSTSTGEYTVGSDGARLLVHANVSIDTFDEANNAYLNIQVNGVDQAYATTTGSEAGTEDGWVAVTTTLNLSASDVVRVRIETTSAENTQAGVDKTFVSFVELG